MTCDCPLLQLWKIKYGYHGIELQKTLGNKAALIEIIPKVFFLYEIDIF